MRKTSDPQQWDNAQGSTVVEDELIFLRFDKNVYWNKNPYISIECILFPIVMNGICLHVVYH